MYIKTRTNMNGLSCSCTQETPQLSGRWTNFKNYVWNSMFGHSPKILQGEQPNDMNVTAGVER